MIYLNYAALSPTRIEAEREVTATLEEFQQLLYSDAGIQWYLTQIGEYRQVVARFLHVDDPTRIAFVSNASTANHLVLSAMEWEPGSVICTSSHENPSILRELRRLALQGVTIQTISPTTPHTLMARLEQAVTTTRVKAILLSHVSHVDGRIFPVEEISAFARVHNILCLIDGAQAVGHIPVDLRQLDGAVYFFTGHKWCEGPLGTGAVVVPDQFLTLNPTFARVAKDHDRPPATLFEIGTQNIGLIAGLVKACALKQHEGLHTSGLEALREEALKRLETCPGLRFLGWQGPQAPGILTVQGRQDIDHVKLGKTLADRYTIIVKVFSDYPEAEIPAIRLSWSASAPNVQVREAVATLAECFS